MTLTDFLLARIAEDAAAAKSATPGPWKAFDMGDAVFTSDDNTGWWWVWKENDSPFYNGVMEIDRYGRTDRNGDPVGAVGTAIATDNREGNVERQDAEHIARWDPARVLAECQAKRKLIELAPPSHYDDPHYNGYTHAHDDVLMLLAQPYAGHPDYDPAWGVA